MRHNRARAFTEALREPSSGPRRWRELSDDPNDPRVLVQRGRALHDAWQPAIADRAAFIEARCTGKAVLDVGCVAHDVARFESSGWLHGRIAAAANRCVGVDLDPDGVEAMLQRGYQAVVHDLSDGLGPLADAAPFDVIVAGEVIEHLVDLEMLFETAAAALTDDGQLIITTPNPYDPDRVWAGQRGVIWENADHVLYAFPAGIAELAARFGLTLSEARSTARARPLWTSHPVRALKRWIRGSGWKLVGFTTTEGVRPIVIRPMQVLFDAVPLRRRRFIGSTFIYVVRRSG